MTTHDIPADGTTVRVRRHGLLGVVHHHSPTGRTALKSGLVWLETADTWSDTVPEHPGFWATRSDYDLLEDE